MNSDKGFPVFMLIIGLILGSGGTVLFALPSPLEYSEREEKFPPISWESPFGDGDGTLWGVDTFGWALYTNSAGSEWEVSPHTKSVRNAKRGTK